MSFWEALTADNSSFNSSHYVCKIFNMLFFHSNRNGSMCTGAFYKGCLRSWLAQWIRKNKYVTGIWKIVFVSYDYQYMYMISSQSMKHISTLNTMKEKHVVRLSPAVSKHFSLWLTFMPCTKFHYEVVFQTFVFVFILILFTCWFLSSTTKSCKTLIWLISYIYIGNKSEIIII